MIISNARNNAEILMRSGKRCLWSAEMLVENVVFIVLSLDEVSIRVACLLAKKNARQYYFILIPTYMFSDAHDSLRQHVHQLLLSESHLRIRPLATTASKGVTEWLLTPD